MNGRLFLIHWNEKEAEAHADVLREMGWEVELESQDGAYACKRIKAAPPDVVVIYLTRLPSHGVATAAYLQSARITREIPIVVVGGSPEKVEQVREMIPEGVYIEPFQIGEALQDILL